MTGKPPSDKKAGTPRTHGAESSRKVLGILAYFRAKQPFATIDELAQAIDVPKSTAYRYVALLRELNFVTDNGRGGYHLAPLVLQMAAAAEAAMSYIDIAYPIMDRLSESTGETVLLLRRVGDTGVCISRVESANPIRLFFEVGRAMPLHLGASPKVLLANMPLRERTAYLARVAKADPEMQARLTRFVEDLDEIRETGISISQAEITPDIWAVAAPVIDGDRVVASISVAGPAYRLHDSFPSSIKALTSAAAQQISAALAQARSQAAPADAEAPIRQ
jgi:DNA-binding IclR family transcriptional regulator